MCQCVCTCMYDLGKSVCKRKMRIKNSHKKEDSQLGKPLRNLFCAMKYYVAI